MRIQKIPLALLGAGTVGKALISQILRYGDIIASRTGFSFVPITVANSTGALVDQTGLSTDTLRSISDPDPGWEGITAHKLFSDHPTLAEISQEGLIVVDLTASSTTAPFLRESLEEGFGVVLANKIPLSGPWEEACVFFESPNVRYESTAGAGLPWIETLHYLLDTGDQIISIEGSFSGTLGYLCTELERKVPYSEAITTACELGYAEPDPRIDLSGKDVARKALILARTAGWRLSNNDLPAKPLFPVRLADLALDDFLSQTRSLDDEYLSLFSTALANQHTFRYAARLTLEGGEVGLIEVERTSSLGSLQGPANLLTLRTKRYDQNPITITGPGAGPAVTAAGVLGDLTKLARRKRGG